MNQKDIEAARRLLAQFNGGSGRHNSGILRRQNVSITNCVFRGGKETRIVQKGQVTRSLNSVKFEGFEVEIKNGDFDYADVIELLMGYATSEQ